MDVNNRYVNRLVAYLATDSIDFEIAIVVILLWLQRTSPLTTWLLRKRLSLQRILNERRLGIENLSQLNLSQITTFNIKKIFAWRERVLRYK